MKNLRDDESISNLFMSWNELQKIVGGNLFIYEEAVLYNHVGANTRDKIGVLHGAMCFGGGIE